MAYEDSLHGVLQGLLLLALLWATWGGTVASERTASSRSGKVEALSSNRAARIA
jgi:hypothetical protein